MDISDITHLGFKNHKTLNEAKSLKWFATNSFLNGDSCPVKKRTLRLKLGSKGLTTTDNKPVKFKQLEGATNNSKTIDQLIRQRDRLDKLVNPYPDSIKSIIEQHELLRKSGVINETAGFKKVANMPSFDGLINRFPEIDGMSYLSKQDKMLGLSKISDVHSRHLKDVADLYKTELINKDVFSKLATFGNRKDILPQIAQLEQHHKNLALMEKIEQTKKLLVDQFGGLDGLKKIAEQSIANKVALDNFSHIDSYDKLKIRDITNLSVTKAINSVDDFTRMSKSQALVADAFNSAMKDVNQYRKLSESLLDSGVIPSISERKALERSIPKGNQEFIPRPGVIRDHLPPPKKDNAKEISELKDEIIALKNTINEIKPAKIAKECLSRKPNLKRPSKFTPPESVKSVTREYAIECTYFFEEENNCLPTKRELWNFIRVSISSEEINIAGFLTEVGNGNDSVIIEGKRWDKELCRKFHNDYFQY